MPFERSRSGDVRLPVAFAVRFQVKGEPASGVAINVSPEGLCLHTRQSLKEGQVLVLTLSAPEYPEVETQAQVRWVVEMSPMLQPTFPFEAGLRIEDPPQAFLDLFHRENVRFVDYRDAPRYPNQMRVQLAGPGTWETTFALNIGRRGLFVRTVQEGLEPGALVQIKVHMPGYAEPIPIRAEVVHRLGPEHALDVGAEPGIGVRILSMPAAMKDPWDRFMTSLEERFAV